MLSPPTDLSADQVAAALRREWRMQPRSLEYLPVGFGAHHWRAEADTEPRFVTLHDLRLHGASADAFDALRRTFQAARQLYEQARLEFVVAAQPTISDELVVPLGRHYALSLYAWLDVQPLDDPDGAITASVVARLHRASAALPDLPAPREDFAIPHRAALEGALRAVDRPWRSGPYAEPARALLRRHQVEVQRALVGFDRLVALARGLDYPWCLTHGEPSGWNLVQDAAGAPRLVDWDSARMAPPERDLWQLDHHPRSLEDYQSLTGGPPPNADLMRLYRLGYALSETAVYLLQFRARHAENANMAESWQNYQTFLPTAERWPELSRQDGSRRIDCQYAAASPLRCRHGRCTGC